MEHHGFTPKKAVMADVRLFFFFFAATRGLLAEGGEG
jgi:hypothetical protein